MGHVPQLKGIDITRGILGRKRTIVARVIKDRWDVIAENRPMIIPPRIINYAKSAAKMGGLNLKEVLSSTPVKNYRDKVWLDR